jgi:hypothetical protein
MKTPGVCVVSLALALALPAAGTPQRASSRLASYSHALVELRPGVDPHAVTSAGATLVSRDLRIWRLRTPATLRLLPSLERTGSVQTVEPDLPYIEFDHLTHGDPLIPAEWWISKVGLNRAEPPGPGVPVTVLDTGLDLTHPEFSSRPATVPLNAQRIDGSDDVHGTAVSSIAAAPANGIGLVGVYPRALLHVLRARPRLVVDVQNGLPFGSTLVTRRPVVVLVHHVHREQWPIVFGRVGGAVGWWIESVLAPRLYRRSRYVTVSAATAEELAAQGIAAQRISVVPNGVEPPCR